ncbi:glycosyltransferase family 2 protein [Vannielia litorea]|uniref:glycosyltransferase family 2 protein n=1 Tax=Vannielia litorea TaxID=1217970 RepID=UPI001C9532E8|nr:glycosyltransferase family 2 protein [Vannielia litorea]MBY6153972.1 glycosyltransferase family 2 protein [Vannielia litorea]
MADLIISLTTIPSRFAEVGETLETLLWQTAQPAEVRLYIPHRYRRFADYDGSLPDVPKGIRILRPEEDLGPATKVLFAAEELRGEEDVQILFGDDDRLYDRRWAAKLSRFQSARPDQVVALSGREIDRDLRIAPPADRVAGPRFERRAGWQKTFDWGYIGESIVRQVKSGSFRRAPVAERASHRWVGRAGYADILQGWGGVIVRPQFFGPEAMELPKVAYPVDDVWLSGMVARRGVPIWVAEGLPAPLRSGAHEHDALWALAASKGDPEDPDRACVAYLRETFGIWPTAA